MVLWVTIWAWAGAPPSVHKAAIARTAKLRLVGVFSGTSSRVGNWCLVRADPTCVARSGYTQFGETGPREGTTFFRNRSRLGRRGRRDMSRRHAYRRAATGSATDFLLGS